MTDDTISEQSRKLVRSLVEEAHKHGSGQNNQCCMAEKALMARFATLEKERDEAIQKWTNATLELSRLRVQPQIDREREGENITPEILDFRMREP